MSKDERILKKVGKLLKLYGVSDEEKDKFLIDLQDKKYDDEEEPTKETSEEVLEENKQEEVVENKEEKLDANDEAKKPEDEVAEEGEEKKVEGEEEGKEVVEEKQPEEQEEVINEEKEEVVEEEQKQPAEEELGEENQFDYKAKIDELQKANDGLSARIHALEDIVAELGVEKKEDKTVGANPNGNAVDETYNSAFDEINRKRVG